jgi:hypothetical protein
MSAAHINCVHLLHNGIGMAKAKMHGNTSICVALEYREKPVTNQHLDERDESIFRTISNLCLVYDQHCYTNHYYLSLKNCDSTC